MTLHSGISDVNSAGGIEYIPETLIAALDEDWSDGDSAASAADRGRRRLPKNVAHAMQSTQDAAAAAERWTRPFRSADSPVLWTFMAQCRQAGERKAAGSKGLWTGKGKGLIAQASYKVLGLDDPYVGWNDDDVWHGLHQDFDRPVRLDELLDRVSVVVFRRGTYDAATQTYTAGCHTLCILGIGHSIKMDEATPKQRRAIKRVTEAANKRMGADPAGSTGRVKNPLSEHWEIHVLRDAPFASLGEIRTALGLTRDDAVDHAEPQAPASRGIGPVVADIAGKLLRDRRGPEGWGGNVEIFVHAVIEASLERLGLTVDRGKACRTAASIARKFWGDFDPTKMGAPRRAKNPGRLSGDLEDVARTERQAAAGKLIGAERRDAAKATIAKIKSAYVRLTLRHKGEEPGQDDVAVATGLSRRTLSTHWRKIRAVLAGALNALERVNTLKSRQRAACSLNKTGIKYRAGAARPTNPVGASSELTAWLRQCAESCPRGSYPPPMPLASINPGLAAILPGASVQPVMPPRIPARDAEALRLAYLC